MAEKMPAPAGTQTRPPDVAAIYHEHGNRLRRFIAGRVSFRDDVEDILQNVFYSLSKADLAENPIEHISAWLYAVARNQITDRFRKRREQSMPSVRRDEEEGDDWFCGVSELLADDSLGPEADYLRTLIRDELALALDELPPEQRRVFELTELEGVPFREIAEATGIPLNTLLSRKRLAVERLRVRLRDLYDEVTGG